MLKIQFTNAKVHDEGYGLYVNGKGLDEIISTALGTRVGDQYGYNSELPRFSSDCCNITITIDPLPATTLIEFDEGASWDSIEDMEESMREQYKETIKKAES